MGLTDMKKLLTFIFLALPLVALGQTFPVNNLQINGAVSGNVSGTGNVVLQTAPSITSPVVTGGSINNATVGQTTASTGAFTTLTSTSDNTIAIATCKNTAGDGAIIQAAVNTGKAVTIVGPCVMDSSVTVSTPGQRISGQGRHSTVLTQSSILATGTFICNTAEPGPVFSDFALDFVQPDTVTRSALTQYNPAFACRNTPRARFRNLYIQAAMVAFDLQGNCGGAEVLDSEVSAFNATVLLDGSLDTVRIDKLHAWNFGLTANQLTIYQQYALPSASGGILCSTFTGTVGICVGRMDDLKLTDSLFIMGGPQIYVATGTGGPGGSSWPSGNMFGHVMGTSFDTSAGIYFNQAGGNLKISGSYFNQAPTGQYGMTIVNGAITCASCGFNVNTNPSISIASTGVVVMSAGYVQLNNGNAFVANAGGNLIMNGFLINTATSYNTGVVTCTSAASCVIVGNSAPVPLTNPTNFINFTGNKTSTGNFGATNWNSL